MTLGKDDITTGASNDIQRATEVARNMVTKWGLSKYGPANVRRRRGRVSSGARQRTANYVRRNRSIDKKVRSIIDDCYAKAFQLLEDNRDKLDMMADA